MLCGPPRRLPNPPSADRPGRIQWSGPARRHQRCRQEEAREAARRHRRLRKEGTSQVGRAPLDAGSRRRRSRGGRADYARGAATVAATISSSALPIRLASRSLRHESSISATWSNSRQGRDYPLNFFGGAPARAAVPRRRPWRRRHRRQSRSRARSVRALERGSWTPPLPNFAGNHPARAAGSPPLISPLIQARGLICSKRRVPRCRNIGLGLRPIQ